MTANCKLQNCVAHPTGCATCRTFRHRHFRLSRLIEIAGVEEGNAEVGERKKKRARGMSVPLDARAADVADGFWYLCVFARHEDHVFPHLPECEGSA